MLNNELTAIFVKINEIIFHIISWKIIFLILQIGENIPLRIMLLLMDEVFDLRHKNMWLRRQIVRILKQLIKAILGDRMNK